MKYIIKIEKWLSTWDQYIEESKKITAMCEAIAQFDFNGIEVKFSKETDASLLWRDYQNAHIKRYKTIGPICLKELPPEEIKAINQREKEIEEEREAQQREWELKDKAQRQAYEGKTKDESFTPVNPEEYNSWKEKNSDPYSRCCFDYAESWAKLIQASIKNGETLEQCAERTSHELGFYGITGFMYGMAVNILSKCWEHGESLRKWHNKEYNHEGEGVVNPAILTIKTD